MLAVVAQARSVAAPVRQVFEDAGDRVFRRVLGQDEARRQLASAADRDPGQLDILRNLAAEELALISGLTVPPIAFCAILAIY